MNSPKGAAALLIGVVLGVLAFMFPGPQYSIVDNRLLGLLGPTIGVIAARGLKLLRPPRSTAKTIFSALVGALVLKLSIALLIDRSAEGMAAATAGFLRDGLWYGIAFAFAARGLGGLSTRIQGEERTLPPAEPVSVAAFLPSVVGIVVLILGVVLATLFTGGR